MQPGPGGKGRSETREGVPGDRHSQAKARGRDSASKAGAKRGGGEGAEAPAGSSALPSSCLARASGGLSVPTAEPGSAFLALLFVDLWTAPRAPAGLRGETQGGSWLSHSQLGAPASPGLAGCACPCPHAQPARSTGCARGAREDRELGGRRGELRVTGLAAFDRRGQRCPVEHRAAGQPVTSEFQTDNRSFLV